MPMMKVPIDEGIIDKSALEDVARELADLLGNNVKLWDLVCWRL